MIVSERKITSVRWKTAQPDSLVVTLGEGTNKNLSYTMFDENSMETNNPLDAVMTKVRFDIAIDTAIGSSFLEANTLDTNGIFTFTAFVDQPSPVTVIEGYDLSFLNKRFPLDLFSEFFHKGTRLPLRCDFTIENHKKGEVIDYQLTWKMLQERNI